MSEVLDNILPQLDETEYRDIDGSVISDYFEDDRREYAEYVAQAVSRLFSFQDWYEQTYSKRLDEEQLKLFLGEDCMDLLDTVYDGVETVLQQNNQA
jgi:hypothetical protein